MRNNCRLGRVVWFLCAGLLIALAGPGQLLCQTLHPTKALGMTKAELVAAKGTGQEVFDDNSEGKTLAAIVYNETWFLQKDAVPVSYEFGPDLDKVIQITVKFPQNKDREAVMKKITQYAGKLVQKGQSTGDVLTVYEATWLGDGLMYNLEDFGTTMDLSITPAYFEDAADLGLPDSALTLASETGKVTAPGVEADVSLVGTRSNGSDDSYDALYICIDDPRTDKQSMLKLPTSISGGFAPRMFLGDFTGDKLDDVLVTTVAAGNITTMNAAIYSFAGGKKTPILNSTVAAPPKFTGQLESNYRVVMSIPGQPKKMAVSLRGKAEKYEADGVYSKGKLVKPVKLSCGGYADLKPAHADSDKIYELRVTQRVFAPGNADEVAQLGSVIKWVKGAWKTLSWKLFALTSP